MDPSLVSDTNPLNVDNPSLPEKPIQHKILLIILTLTLLTLVAVVFSWRIFVRPAISSVLKSHSTSLISSTSGLIATTSTPLPVSTMSPLPTSDPSIVSRWRTYSAANYSLSYPSSLLPPQDIGGCTHLSDLPNPQASPSAIIKDHTWITMCWETSDMPTAIPPDPLSADLTMSQSFTLNSYLGIMGYRNPRFNTSLGPVQTVYLSHPYGSYIELQLNAGSQSDFGQIVSSIKFLDSNHGHIKINNGNVYYLSPSGQSVFANKDDFTQIDYAPPIKFTEARLSPDQSKVFLFAQGGITSELLFYSKVNPVSVKYIHPVSQAQWSPSSRYIVYTSHIADAGGDYYLGLYDTVLDRNMAFPEPQSGQKISTYSINAWLPDETGLSIHHIDQSSAPYGDVIGEGDLVVHLSEFTQQ